MKQNQKHKIKDIALRYFCEKGYYGTSIRDIARDAECSLPTVYYYFKNKDELFEELAYHDFIDLTKRLRGEISVKEDIKEMYIQSVLQRINLEGTDKLTYILATKTILGMDPNILITNQLREWEETRYHYAQVLLKDYFNIDNKVYGNILSRVSSTIILKALLYNQEFSDEDVRNELQTLFKMIMEDNK